MKTSKSVSLLICVAACLFAGCIDQGDEAKDSLSEDVSELAVAITSPSSGVVISGGDLNVKFESSVSGGNNPYSYHWSSSLDGAVSSEKSFKWRSSDMSKGRHVIILRVADATGQEKQASITVTAL